ncbi:MAG: glycoside hydrolase family 125 protein [Bacillota bacterium]|nr:glycoside hydrolase family 125 protein [Bacillota bacterium]
MNDSSEPYLTVPESISPEGPLFMTGNEYIALPQIDKNGSIHSANVLRLDCHGLLEFCGSAESPLLTPILQVEEEAIDPGNRAEWNYEMDWLPGFCLSGEEWTLKGEIVCPPGYKGFFYRLSLANRGSHSLKIKLGWKICWTAFNYLVFHRRPVGGSRRIDYNSWTNSLVLEAVAGLPLAALALAVEPQVTWHQSEDKDCYQASCTAEVEAGECYTTTLYGAANLEADGAGTTTVDLRRHGAENLKLYSLQWLENRGGSNEGEFTALLKRNLFFSYFYSTARSLDSEEVISLTSRSPRYYVSAAFWSRDALLWSFPAVMMVHQGAARELLLSVFRRHLRNCGEHAHYLNGTLLYPGFELDQLCAYFLALSHYLAGSDDYTLLENKEISEGLTFMAEKALDLFDPEAGLYSTFLDPSDDPVPNPYLTYDNALLQCSFCFLGHLQAGEHWRHKADFAILASELQQAIYENCIVKGPFGAMFAWSVDGKGRFTLYDNPPGSLQLLAHYGFCFPDETVFRNTVRWIRSANNKYFHSGAPFEEAGSRHAGNPWPLAACNDLLSCNAGGLDFLKRAAMDNGFFCETVDPQTGKLSTGAAFASGAGFLAFALANRHGKEECPEEPETG